MRHVVAGQTPWLACAGGEKLICAGELRSVVATHFPSGDKAPPMAPSPRRTAGRSVCLAAENPVSSRRSLLHFRRKSDFGHPETSREPGTSRTRTDSARFFHREARAIIPDCMLSSVISTRPSRVMSCRERVAGTRMTSRSLPDSAEGVDRARRPRRGSGKPHFFSVPRPGHTLDRGAKTGRDLPISIAIRTTTTRPSSPLGTWSAKASKSPRREKRT